MTVTDKLAVAETLYRYAIGIDTRDFVLYRSIFADEVTVDFTSYSGGRASTMTGDQWVAGVEPLFRGLSATQHSMTNPLASIEGEVARCRMYMQAHHVYDARDPDSWFTIGGYYDDVLARSEAGPAGWLITGVTLTVLWRRGDPSVMETARRRPASPLS